MKKVINYDSMISEFLADVKAWLDKRVPRDATEEADIKDTKEMWTMVCQNPRYYVQYGNMYNKVCGHTNAFTLRIKVHRYDCSMLFAVIGVLTAMDAYYHNRSDKQKADLVERIEEYKSCVVKIKSREKIESLKQSLKYLPRKLFVKQH